MRQKDKPQRRCLQENKACKVFWKAKVSNPMINTHTCAYQGNKRCSFFRKFGVVGFFVTPVFEICPFTLLPTNSRYRSNESGVEVYYFELWH